MGEYLEVIDVDPASGVLYQPVNLNDSRILAQNGLAPSESNPQFHQQMVYAVAMATIGHFRTGPRPRRALVLPSRKWIERTVRAPGAHLSPRAP